MDFGQLGLAPVKSKSILGKRKSPVLNFNLKEFMQGSNWA